MTILYARAQRRCVAAMLDIVFILLLMPLMAIAYNAVFDEASAFRAFIVLSPLLLLDPLFVSLAGATPGQFLLGMRVRRSETMGRCPLYLSLPRYFVKLLLGTISLLYMYNSRRHQTLHDRLAGTVVILSPGRLIRKPNFAKYGEEEYPSEDFGDNYPPARGFGAQIVLYFFVLIVFQLILEGVGGGETVIGEAASLLLSIVAISSIATRRDRRRKKAAERLDNELADDNRTGAEEPQSLAGGENTSNRIAPDAADEGEDGDESRKTY